MSQLFSLYKQLQFLVAFELLPLCNCLELKNQLRVDVSLGVSFTLEYCASYQFHFIITFMWPRPITPIVCKPIC